MTEDQRDARLLIRVGRARIGLEAADPALWDEFGELLARHEKAVFRMCMRIVRRREDAEDLAQKAMQTALERLHEFEGRSSVGTWLCGIARFLCFNHVRKHEDLLTADGLIEEADPTASVLRALSRREREETVMEVARACLDAREQEAVRLRYVEQLPYDAIDGVLDLDTRSGARGLLQTCKRKLKPAMRERLREMGIGSTTFLRSGV